MSVGLGPEHKKRTPLFARSYEYLRTYWPDEGERGIPQFYADYDYTHWLILPTPDAGYPLEVMQYELPILLDQENQSNWLTDYAPQALLYAALLEATPFLKNDERIATWQGLYDRSIASLNTEDLDKILDRSATRKEA
jgi:glycine/D-amino acid oxidase-like deaminating enzyme